MNSTLKRIISCALVAGMVAGITACEEEGANPGGVNAPVTSSEIQTAATTEDPELALDKTDKKTDIVSTETYKPSGNAGIVKVFSFYEVAKDQKGIEQCMVFKGPQYGGTIEHIGGASGAAYYEKLGTLVAGDDSPDICLKDAFLFPGTVSKNMFTPLDNYIDMNSPLWVGMKDVIDGYGYKGKHYYYPHKLTTSFGVNYCKSTIIENNLEDPYELYMNNEWTWDKFKELMIAFVDKDNETHIGYYATNTTASAFVNTTGVALIDVKSDGTMTNNLQNENVVRAMNFLGDLYREGLPYQARPIEGVNWIDPADYPTYSDRILFYIMEPEWTYTALSNKTMNKDGVADDIFDTPCDYAFVPMPRDPDAGAYYQAVDTYGFLIPAGAKNVQGAVDFINCFRVYETDPAIAAKVKEDHIHPEPIYLGADHSKYPNARIWEITWDEQQYDLWMEMMDPEKFTFLFEGGFGFTKEFAEGGTDDPTGGLFGVVSSCAFEGESWAQKSEEFEPKITSTFADFAF